MDDAYLSELARRAQRGDPKSFRFLVESESRRLIALAYRYTRDWEASRDLTQETWIKVFQRLRSYDPGRPFRTWLSAIHRNGCLSYLRRPALAHEHPTSEQDVTRQAPPVKERDPLERLESEELGVRLRAAMARLSESQLRVFTRVDLEQVSQADAARALGMKAATLRTPLHFARKRPARWLRRLQDEPWART